MTDNKRAADAERDEALKKWVQEVEGASIEVTSLMRFSYRDGWADRAALSGCADGGKDSSDARDAERYRRIRLGLSDVHGDVYAMVFAGDGDYPEDGDDLDRIVDAAIAKDSAAGASNERADAESIQNEYYGRGREIGYREGIAAASRADAEKDAARWHMAMEEGFISEDAFCMIDAAILAANKGK
jgi:hypothetical protein